MRDLLDRWEAFLRLERLTSASDLFKARTVYVTVIAFIFVQLLNAIQMFYFYGGWALDHTILIIAVTLVGLSGLSLRYQKNFDLFSWFWGSVILAGICGTALPDNVGINTGLLPGLVAGIVIIALVGSRRSLVLFCLGSALLIVCLFLNATNADPSGYTDLDYLHLRNIQRTMQALFAVVMVGAIMGLLSISQTQLFEKLEANLAKAKAAEASKGQFLADMSHELRTPLNGVIGMNQLLLRGELSDQQRNYAEIIEDSGVSMITVIDDILDLSRLESGRITLKPTTFHPARMLDSVMALHQANAHAKGIALNLMIESGLPPLMKGDHGRLRQIVSNLISNAVKFTDEGYVNISLRGRALSDGRWWMNIFVQDTGVGITPDRQARIFDRFEQAQDGQKNTVRGSGLGLAICRELTELFGGEISVTSKPGEGSLFCVAFPLEGVEEEADTLGATRAVG